MTFKLHIRNKDTGSLYNQAIEADNEQDAKDSIAHNEQVISCRVMGVKPSTPTRSTYTPTRTLRARVEHQLMAEQTPIGMLEDASYAARNEANGYSPANI
jgi:hypothetical protein